MLSYFWQVHSVAGARIMDTLDFLCTRVIKFGLTRQLIISWWSWSIASSRGTGGSPRRSLPTVRTKKSRCRPQPREFLSSQDRSQRERMPHLIWAGFVFPRVSRARVYDWPVFQRQPLP